MPEKSKTRGGGVMLALALVALALVFVLLTQRAAATGVGQFVAQLWVSVFDVVLRLIGALLGHS